MTCTYTGGEKLFKKYFYYLVCDFAACIYASSVCSNPADQERTLDPIGLQLYMVVL